MKVKWFVALTIRVSATLFALLMAGCIRHDSGEAASVKAVISRYNQLVADGYRARNMNALQEVATPQQAEKHYFHMAAIGEGRLRMDSQLKGIKYLKFDFSKPDTVLVDTRETWDFAHIDTASSTVFSQEKGYVYEMGYSLKREGGRWVITNVTTVSGESTNCIIPWPQIDRQGNRTYPPGKSPREVYPATDGKLLVKS